MGWMCVRGGCLLAFMRVPVLFVCLLLQEEQAMIEGVQLFGVGQWKQILDRFPDVFVVRDSSSRQ